MFKICFFKLILIIIVYFSVFIIDEAKDIDRKYQRNWQIKYKLKQNQKPNIFK